MATTLSQVESFLGNRNLKFQRDEAKAMVLVPFRTGAGDSLLVVVKLEENGEFLKIFTPKLLTYLNGPHKLALLQALLHVSWETKMLQWEYDPDDGEIRAIVEFPLEDAQLTERQFFRALTGLLQLVEKCLPRLRRVIETGEDPRRGGEPGDDLARAFRDFVNQRIGGTGSDGDSGPHAPDAL